MASTTGRQGNVDSVGKKGPEVAAHPDNEPYPAPAGSPASQFEGVNFDQVRAYKAGQSQHSGAPDGGGGGPSFGAQGSARGHQDAAGLFAAQKGHAPKRSPGKVSPKNGV